MIAAINYQKTELLKDRVLQWLQKCHYNSTWPFYFKEICIISYIIKLWLSFLKH